MLDEFQPQATQPLAKGHQLSHEADQTRPQEGLKLGAIPAAFWRTGAYFTLPYYMKRRGAHRRSSVPAPTASLGGVAGVLADELVLAGFKITRNPPTSDAWQRITSEVSDAIISFHDQGWILEPQTYHLSPVVPADATAHRVKKWESLGLRWEQLRWTSDWTPHGDQPGADRWLGYEHNERASAWVLRHRGDTPRHWAVLVHGTEQGRLLVDQMVFRARQLHHELGCNVVMPLLPLHASRRAHDPTGSGFPTLDVMDNIHGLAQSAYDVRCLLAWIREQEPTGVSLTGLSLGGYVAALVAGLEGPLDAVVGLVPAVDFPEVFRRQTPKQMRNNEMLIKLNEASRVLHSVVSPLSFKPGTPPERLHILAGLHDRLLDPRSQAARLGDHWGTTNVTWVERGHVTHLLSSELGKVLTAAVSAVSDGSEGSEGSITPPT